MVDQFYRTQLREARAALKGVEENADLDLTQLRNIKSARLRTEQVLKSVEDDI